MVRLETTGFSWLAFFLRAEGMDVALERAAGSLERYAAASGIERGMVG